METAGRREDRKLFSTWRYIMVAVGVLVADQWTKWLAVAGLTRAFDPAAAAALSATERLERFLWLKHPLRSDSVTVFEHFWHFRYVENPGAAWGFLSGSTSVLRTPFFLLVPLVAMVFIVSYFRRTLPDQWLVRLGLALVFGGAVGNFADRVRLGYVIDFIDWHWYDTYTWPTFNVADAGITVGVAILLLEMFVQKPQPTAAAQSG